MSDFPVRSDKPLPARRLPTTIGAPQTPPPTDKISFGVLWRGLRRHWWQAMLLWLIGTAGLSAVIWYKIKPTYEATAGISVERAEQSITGLSGSSPINFEEYMLTQVRIVTIPTVIQTALSKHPELTTLLLLRGSEDPIRDIQQALRVFPVNGTNLIEVQMSSQDKDEPAIFVNAVVAAYLDHETLNRDSSNDKLIKELEEEAAAKTIERDNQRKTIQGLIQNVGAAELKAIKDQDVAGLEAFRELRAELSRVDIKRIETKATLDQLKDDRGQPLQIVDPKRLQAAITREFYKDPEVASLQAEIEKKEQLESEANRIARSPSDPSVRRKSQKIADLVAQRNQLWMELEPEIRRRLSTPQSDAETEAEIRKLEKTLGALDVQLATLRDKLNNLRIENKKLGADALSLENAQYDLGETLQLLAAINRNLNEKRFSAKSKIARIKSEYPATPTNRAAATRRTQALLAAPVLMAMLVIGLFALLELRGARVGDPDELHTRINLQVIGVVPPLPQVRDLSYMANGNGNGHVNGTENGHVELNGDGEAAHNGEENGNGKIKSKRGGSFGVASSSSDMRARRQLDEFVQSLDHLRVALCARRDQWGRDRHCVLITSACGSEGKTTLAAQLAERCANADMMTLLIDADLRNPTLSRMLDANESPGLINVLRGEAIAEDVVSVIAEAGGFHFLPAGTPRMDPSRLLQNERLGNLIAQARESFEMIIVDVPPVLPVPDALTIGRWTDGAVLAVRHDVSRFPLVNKAYRQLLNVGVPVLGAVVNGVKPMESAYGYGGYYAYGTSSNTMASGE